MQNGGVYDVGERDAGYRLRIAAVGANASGTAEPVFSALTPVVPPPEPLSLPFDPPPVPAGRRREPAMRRRPVARATARLRPGRSTVRLLLTRPARRRLARGETLVVRADVAAGAGTLASKRLVLRR